MKQGTPVIWEEPEAAAWSAAVTQESGDRFQSVEFFGDRGSVGGVGGRTLGLRNITSVPLHPQRPHRSSEITPCCSTTLWGAQMAPNHCSCHCSRVQDPSDLGSWPCALGSVLKFQSCQGGRSTFQALHRFVQMNIVFPSGLQPAGSGGGGEGRAVTENGNILILWGNLFCLLWPRVGLGSIWPLGEVSWV